MKQWISIKKFWGDNNLTFILLLFLAWRVWITVFALAGIAFLPLAGRIFFGGSLDRYLEDPLFWGWSNFDGEHYIAIAQYGYKFLEHSFFPLYPFFLHLIAPEGIVRIVWAGIAVSNTAFFVSLLMLWKLLRIDYSEEISRWSLVILTIFPTSFYFASVYASSLFLLLIVCSFLAVRKTHWPLSGLFGGFSSATQVFGVALAPAFCVEWLAVNKEKKLFSWRNTVIILSIVCTLGGLVGYMGYLFKTTGNPLSFYSELSPFGQQREVGRIIFFPQVFWRYFKMITTVDRNNLLYFTILIEFFTSVGTLALIVWGFATRLRLSYWVYCVLGYFLSTSTGSFSSLPRYVLSLFPLFILAGQLISETKKAVKFTTLSLLVVVLAIETMLFYRGYWVA